MNARMLFLSSFMSFAVIIGACPVQVWADVNTVKSEAIIGDFKHQSEHFSICSSEDRKEVVLKIIPKLEEKYSLAASHLNKELTDLVEVKVYSNLDEFHKAIGWPSAPDWVRGRAKGGLIEVVLEDYETSNRAIELIIHETTHIITQSMNSSWKYIPPILWEGIATYEAGQVNLKNNLHTLKEIPSIKELFKLRQNKSLYSLAYSFVEFLIQNFGYEKIIELLNIDYKNNECDFSFLRNEYDVWTEILRAEIDLF